MTIKGTLVRSIRRAQKYDLIGRNVVELVNLPQGQPGHPSRAMTEEQAGMVLKAAGGQPTAFVKVVKVGQAKDAATHAATEAGELACVTWTRPRSASGERAASVPGMMAHHATVAELSLVKAGCGWVPWRRPSYRQSADDQVDAVCETMR